MKLSDIKRLWKKKIYSEENIVSVHWQILQLLILAVPVHQVSKKKTMLSRQTNLIIVFFTYVIQYSFVNASFLDKLFLLFKVSLSNFASVKFVSVKRKFAWIVKKLTSISSFNIKLSKICFLQFTSHSLHIQQK